MSRRTSISVHDYPEHLNPFSELHEPQYETEPFKFHTVGRPKKRRSSISNAWNLFASRKTKPVEASLNLSPRLPRSTSLANDELREPVPPARRKLFSDLTWLPGSRRFGTLPRKSSPPTDDSTMLRYRSISVSRTSENPLYQPGETPLFTPRTHRYRSPSLSPSEDRSYTASYLEPAVNGGDTYYPAEQRDRSASERLYIQEPPPRTRSSSMSPTVNGGPYNTRLYIDEPSPQRFERLYIDEANDRQNDSSKNMYDDRPSSVSPTSDSGRQSPAVIPSHERPSPYDEPLVPQRPPRPPRTKKRRAPLPPLPKFAQKPERSPSPTELRITESSQTLTTSEEKQAVPENLKNDVEEQPIGIGLPVEVTESPSNVTDKPPNISELQTNIVELQMNTSEQQSEILEEQTIISNQLPSAVEMQTNTIEQQVNATEQQPCAPEQDSITKEESCEYTTVEEQTYEYTTVEIHASNLEDIGHKAETPGEIIDGEELQKPQTKIRTKFGSEINV